MLIDLEQLRGTAHGGLLARGDRVQSFSGAVVSRDDVGTDQVILAGAKADVLWTQTEYDTGVWFAGFPAANIVVPSGVTRVRLTCQVVIRGSTNFVYGDRIEISPRLNFVNLASHGIVQSAPVVGRDVTWSIVTPAFPVAANDILTIEVNALAITPASLIIPGTGTGADIGSSFGVEAVSGGA